jgi:hypothetical protein
MKVTISNSKPNEKKIKVPDLTDVINEVIYQFYILEYAKYTAKEKR